MRREKTPEETETMTDEPVEVEKDQTVEPQNPQTITKEKEQEGETGNIAEKMDLRRSDRLQYANRTQFYGAIQWGNK